MIRFGKNWKKIQSLAYPVLILTMLHIGLVTEQIVKFYLLVGLYIVLKIIEKNSNYIRKEK